MFPAVSPGMGQEGTLPILMLDREGFYGSMEWFRRRHCLHRRSVRVSEPGELYARQDLRRSREN